MHKSILPFILLFIFSSCHSQSNQPNDSITDAQKQHIAYDTTLKTIHIYVALCDNKYQGIVPVPKLIGNGQDPFNNLYWGCGYGIKTYFKKSSEWTLLKTYKTNGNVLERCVFKNKIHKNTYLVADAYDGQYIKQCTVDFLSGTAGIENDTLTIDGKIAGIKGHSALTAFIGHDGLMDFSLERNYKNADGKKREAIILACVSKPYFADYVKDAGANPLLWTTGLMAPEAYTIHDAISTWLAGKTDAEVRKSAAAAYYKYQKCGEKAARNLLVTGW